MPFFIGELYEKVSYIMHIFSLFLGAFRPFPGRTFLPLCDEVNIRDVLHSLTHEYSSTVIKVYKSH